MRKKRFISIAALVAVIALTVSIPVFASGCGDDEVASVDRLAQQQMDRAGDGDGEFQGRGGRGMMGRQSEGQFMDRDGDCDALGEGNIDCDGDCDSLGRGSMDCDGECDQTPLDEDVETESLSL